MNRAVLVVCLALGIYWAPLGAEGQPPAKVPRIGYLGPRSPSDVASPDAFRKGMRELGYVEGQNIAIEYRWAHGRYERLPDLVLELARLKVDVIVSLGTAATHAAKQATTTIPIVMVSVGDPVGTGVVASLARPGGNITGLSFDAGLELTGKMLELLKEAVPKASRVAVLRNPANPATALAVKEVEAGARSLGVQLQVLDARGPDEFDRAFSAMRSGRAGALLVLPDATFFLHRTQLAELAMKSRLPAIYGSREVAEAGGLMAYGPSITDMGRRAATYVDKILKGAKAGDLPVERPTKYELIVNLKTAKALGLTIPPSVLVWADEVIQ